ncbi:MAG: squalene--hopene cyclase [Elusimicrobia bacterium]|nr:squalene--hopene cyclase [Elusimicrobiota bacterium]
MIRTVSAWLTPSRWIYRKPKDWAENLRPDLADPHPDAAIPEDLQTAVLRAQNAVLQQQNQEEGYWCGPLRADTTIDSDTIMLLNFLGRGSSIKVRRFANRILKAQLSDGGWPIYPSGPADISATVKAYWALKFAGHSPNEPSMVRARRRIRELGGIHKVNTYTKFYLAIFGQYDWAGVPTIPPELMLFPNWFYFNIYQMSSWTRSIVVPLSVVWASQPRMTCPTHAVIDELFPDSRRHVPLSEAVGPHSFVSWTNFFLWWDRGLKVLEGRGPHWIRVWALRLAEDWLLERLQGSDGLGAIYPGIVNTILAMKCLGYGETDPRLVEQLQILERLELPGEDLQMQPCQSPVWDTAISVIALAESGLDRNHPLLVRAADWLISREITTEGDWKVGNPKGHPGGWAFEFNNEFYPDVDDTAMVMLALRHVYLDEPLTVLREKACQRGLHWMLSMQCSNGGWAAFDKDNTKTIFNKIPFADHNAMIDPPAVDITGRVLEFMGYIGFDGSYPSVARAVEYIRSEQEADGSWYGRWGVNYIYGTWQVLRGLAAVDEDMSQACIQRAADWLKSVQREDGGWGETCATYQDPRLKGRGPSTPSQTAWAVQGLMAAGVYDEAVERGIEYLIRTQREDGRWDEAEFTGTGFPKVFYLEYTMYRDNFPLQTLGTYLRMVKESQRAAMEMGLKEARGGARV